MGHRSALLVPRRGAALLLVLSVGVALLGALAAAAPRLVWSQRAVGSAWDRVALDFAVVEVVRAAATTTCLPWAAPTVRLITTANRRWGRIELTPLAPLLWRVRWGVAGEGRLWHAGEWFAVARGPAAGCPSGVTLTPVPGLPPDR